MLNKNKINTSPLWAGVQQSNSRLPSAILDWRTKVMQSYAVKVQFIKPKISLWRQFLNHLINYPTPIALNYAWNFGSLAGICLVIQIVTGIFLAMHYTPTLEGAYDSLQQIMRDVPHGWLLRNIHATGASIFFALVYCHLGKNLYYKTYLEPNYTAWASGLILFVLLMAIAFLGYILPWGQMSLWGATVITNLFSAIPIIGKTITAWLWGGNSVAGPTLHRFAALHYALPFIMLGLVFVHLALIHDSGSNHPAFIQTTYLPFYPYFFLKDLFGFLGLTIIWAYFIFFEPALLSSPDNLIPADPLVTPRHIVPEWYFLPFYAILRAIPNKLGGVCYMFAAILILFLLPLFENLGFRYARESIYNSWSQASPPVFQLFHQMRFWLLVSTFALLGWLGSKPAIDPYVSLSLTFTFVYFFLITFGNTIASLFDEITLHVHLLTGSLVNPSK